MNYFRKRRDCLVDLGFQCDLRFFDYGADRTIADIYCDDQSEIKLTTKEKYESIITSETEYWNRIMSYSDEEDL